MFRSRTRKNVSVTPNAPVQRLHRDVSKAFSASVFAGSGAAAQFTDAVFDMWGSDLDSLTPALQKGFRNFALSMYRIQRYTRPPMELDAFLSSGRPIHYLMDDLGDHLEYLSNPEPHLQALAAQIISVFETLLSSIPRAIAQSNQDGFFNARLSTLFPAPEATVTDIIKILTASDEGYLDTVGYLLQSKLAELSKLPANSDKPRIYPDDPKAKHLSPDQYVEGTPLEDLFSILIPIHISYKYECEHSITVAGAGWGKTQAAIGKTLKIFDDRKKPSLFLMDSTTETINIIMDNKRFAPGGDLHERLIYIDPTGYDHVPAINLFDWSTASDVALSPAKERERYKLVIRNLTYILSVLFDGELTALQKGLFNNACRVLLRYKGATLHTLIDLLEDHRPFQHIIDSLDASTQKYFATQYDSKKSKPRRQEIVPRLWLLLSDPTFAQVFASPETKIDLTSELQAGKIVLVNTAKSSLGAVGCKAYGQYWLSLLEVAAFNRFNIPDKRMCYVIIDEAPNYFDEVQLPSLMAEVRKFGFGIHSIQQSLSQGSTKLRAAQASNTNARLIGRVSFKDASALAEECNTKPDLFMNLRRDPGNKWAEYVLYLRQYNLATVVRVEYPYLNPPPGISENELEATLNINRDRYYATVSDLSYEPPAPKDDPKPDCPAKQDSPVASKVKKPHRKIQERLLERVDALGLIGQLERSHKEQSCRVDLAIDRFGKSYAVQVSTTNKAPYEAGVLPAVFRAGYEEVVIVSPDSGHLDAILTKAKAALSEADFAHVRVMSEADCFEWIDTLAEGGSTGHQIKYS